VPQLRNCLVYCLHVATETLMSATSQHAHILHWVWCFPSCLEIWCSVPNISNVVLSGVCKQNIRRKMKHWMEKQLLVLWHGPCSIQRQAREMTSGLDMATRARLLSFNRTQSRIDIGLLTGHNTLRRHLYIMGLSNNPICRICSAERETSVHILCEC
jgi:hypothetical protein